jgi:hypothetical protein
MVLDNYKRMLDKFALSTPPYPDGRFDGRGVVICAGGEKYLRNAWVCVNMLRHVNCSLPVELWYIGEGERVPKMMDLFPDIGVTLVDAERVREIYPTRRLGGWEIKPFAVINSPFKDVLLLDADNVVVRDPEYLFDTYQFRTLGSVFWQDICHFRKDSEIWPVTGIPYRKVWEFESGQLMVDKKKCWRSLMIAMHMNEHSDYYYRHIHGDKETYNFAWMYTKQVFGMPPTPPFVMMSGKQFVGFKHADFVGDWVFQHRIGSKWEYEKNVRCPVFEHEDVCVAFAEDLRSRMAK